MKSIKSKVIVVMCVALLIMVTGYAYFATNLDITATGNITTSWKVNFISITQGNNGGTGGSNASTPTYTDTTATMSANLAKPGDYMEYDLVVKNSGNIDAIIESIDANATGSPAIIFSISGINEGDKLAGGVSKKIKIKIEYDYYVTSQPSETTKILTVSISAIQDTGQTITPSSPNQPSVNQPTYLSSAIFRDNVAYADNVASPYVTASTGIDFSAINSDTNGKGLYYTNKNTENNDTTYYFRGNVNNNNVKFGSYNKPTCTYNGEDVIFYTDHNGGYIRDYLTEEQCTGTQICDLGTSSQYRYATGLDSTWCEGVFGLGEKYLADKATYNEKNIDLYWKIVRINEDGSIRLVSKDSVGYAGFNTEYHYNAFVGYMYGNYQGTTYQDTHQNINSSNMKNYLDNWYGEHSNLNDYSNLLADAGFCGDKSVYSGTGVDIDHSYYGARNRLIVNKKPQFKCPQTSDLFTTNASSNGNKKLVYPVGLLTADEVAYSGTVLAIKNTDYYLYNGEDYWTMSSDKREGIGAYVFYVETSGLFTGLVSAKNAVRPVINLKSTVSLSSELPEGCIKQDGTEACPYIIKTN